MFYYLPGSLSASYLLTVEVDDVNDIPPTCTSTVFHASVSEGAVVSTSVAELDCSDEDKTAANQIASYAIVSESPGGGKVSCKKTKL